MGVEIPEVADEVSEYRERQEGRSIVHLPVAAARSQGFGGETVVMLSRHASYCSERKRWDGDQWRPCGYLEGKDGG